MIMKIILVTFLITFLLSSTEITANKCGYENCNLSKPNILNVHVIAHTHDDVGWLKTVDQYYYGASDNIQSAGVQYILDTVVKCLMEDENRRFSYVEIAFFYRWWQNQPESVKTQVKMLVNQGRLQFVSGGWSMNDEAATHYTAIIDQMTVGLDFLNQTFGKCGLTSCGWQIDPFGHSIEQANLFAEFGFDGWLFGRLDYQEHNRRLSKKTMEFLQATSTFDGAKSKKLFTSILFDMYCQPGGLCFDDKCQDNPIIDNKQSYEYNVKQKVNKFMQYIRQYSKAFNTNNILIPMGCDFQFQNAYHNFINLDKLIKYTNELYGKEVNVFYSTPPCYIYAVNKANKTYSIRTDDYFPYASDKDTFWTGYFTSRSTLKGFVRHSNKIFQMTKKLLANSNLNNDVVLSRLVEDMARKMGVLQHHDAVSGTEKQLVAKDYMRQLADGLQSCQTVINVTLHQVINPVSYENKINYDFQFCLLLNISSCKFSDNLALNKSLTIMLYNPLEYQVTKWIRVPVYKTANNMYDVNDENNTNVPFQYVPISQITKSIPEREKNLKSNYELVFQGQIPPIALKIFKITNKPLKIMKIQKIHMKKSPNIVENTKLRLEYNNGFLVKVINKVNNVSVDIKQNMLYYYSYDGNGRKSGAYIFRPKFGYAENITNTPKIKISDGPLVKEVQQIFGDYASLITRLYKDSDLIESQWTVGPLPNDKKGREVIIRFDTNLKSSKEFLVDSNGRQMIRRKFRSNLSSPLEEVSGNYYPVDSTVVMDDPNAEVGLLVHTDRAQGCGSMKSGEIEFMVHRRCFFDDGFGVAEPLNETGTNGAGLIARGKHWFTVDKLDRLIQRRKSDALTIFNEPETLFAKNSPSNKFGLSLLNPISYNTIEVESLPRGLHILSLENHINFDSNEVDYKILRLENILPMKSSPIKVDMNKLFIKKSIRKFEELNLSANQILQHMNHLNWAEQKSTNQISYGFNDYKSMIYLKPGQIRTFRVYF